MAGGLVAAAWGALVLQSAVGQLPVFHHLAAAAVLATQLYLPIWRCDAHGLPLAAIGLTYRGAARAAAEALLGAALVLPLYAGLSHWLLLQPPAAAAWLGLRPHCWVDAPLPVKSLLQHLPGQLLGVALPEEVLFRGYLQAQLGNTLLAPAALFAVSHLMGHQGSAGLWTFFPGLLFGWLRRRSPSLLGCILLHATCNLFAEAWLCHFRIG